MDSVWNLLHTCVPCALKSLVRPQRGDGIDLKIKRDLPVS